MAEGGRDLALQGALGALGALAAIARERGDLTEGQIVVVTGLDRLTVRELQDQGEALLDERGIRSEWRRLQECCATDHARVCSQPGCLAATVRRDDGAHVCAAGHPTRWVDVAEVEPLRTRVAELETALSRVIDAISSVPPLGERVASLVQAQQTDGLQCSFCGKSQKEAKVLLAGPAVYICEVCAETAARISADVVAGR